jgi:hypothetical protein
MKQGGKQAQRCFIITEIKEQSQEFKLGSFSCQNVLSTLHILVLLNPVLIFLLPFLSAPRQRCQNPAVKSLMSSSCLNAR